MTLVGADSIDTPLCTITIATSPDWFPVLLVAPSESIASSKSSSTIIVRFMVPGGVFAGIVAFRVTLPLWSVVLDTSRVSFRPPRSSHRKASTPLRALLSAASVTLPDTWNSVPATTSTCWGVGAIENSLSRPICSNRSPENGMT